MYDTSLDPISPDFDFHSWGGRTREASKATCREAVAEAKAKAEAERLAWESTQA